MYKKSKSKGDPDRGHIFYRFLIYIGSQNDPKINPKLSKNSSRNEATKSQVSPTERGARGGGGGTYFVETLLGFIEDAYGEAPPPPTFEEGGSRKEGHSGKGYIREGLARCPSGSRMVQKRFTDLRFGIILARWKGESGSPNRSRVAYKAAWQGMQARTPFENRVLGGFGRWEGV